MPDPRALREIVDALRVLHDKADAAGYPTARALLSMTTAALNDMAKRAAADAKAFRPADMVRRLGER